MQIQGLCWCFFFCNVDPHRDPKARIQLTHSCVLHRPPTHTQIKQLNNKTDHDSLPFKAWLYVQKSGNDVIKTGAKIIII